MQPRDSCLGIVVFAVTLQSHPTDVHMFVVARAPLSSMNRIFDCTHTLPRLFKDSQDEISSSMFFPAPSTDID